jgi:precorrin-2 dehydrogenase/sirohydrochlorin ferrochelatase
MAKTYPINLLVAGRACVVIGGGAVAARKAKSLCDAGAKVAVIAPEIDPEIAALADEGRLTIARRAFAPADLHGAFVAVAATDDAAVNRAAFEAARARGVLINVVDQPGMCDFYVPAVIARGDVQIAISTGGAGPGAAKLIRRDLETRLGDEYAALLAIVAACRDELYVKFPKAPARRHAAMQRVLALDLLGLIRAGRLDDARAEARACI